MPPFRLRPRVFELPTDADGGALLARLGPGRGAVLLDSAGGAPADWTWLGFDPLPEDAPPASIDGLRARLASLVPEDGDAVPGPFAGGWLGALAYDLGVAGEDLALPDEPWGLPLVGGGLYVDFVVRDERAGRAWLVLGEEPGDGRAPVDVRRARLVEQLSAPPARELAYRPRGALRRATSSAEHRARIERLREQIAAGETYQANLAHRMTLDVEGSPLALYARLRETNRAPYMGYVELGSEGAVLSASPELLLEVADGVARTRPIKGTAPRGADPAEDARLAEGLLASPKDRAELGMIVDLERNDLGRVCRAGGVRVGDFPRLESYASVHHLVADVEGELAPGRGALDALAALFPGGSITGAPKLRSMELIAELEGEGRGYFTGAAGFVGLDGRARLGILIRTLTWRPRPERGAEAGEVSFRVGGGITWASDAAAEDAETLAKARSLAAALGVPLPDAETGPALEPGGGSGDRAGETPRGASRE